jgi:2-keto-3-deoxy-L-rhamnonate aldolase RhmA
MGVEFGGDEHEAAISKILEVTHKAGKIAGIFCKCSSARNLAAVSKCSYRFDGGASRETLLAGIRHGQRNDRY